MNYRKKFKIAIMRVIDLTGKCTVSTVHHEQASN